MKRRTHPLIILLSPLLLYGAVLIGLYGFRSGWAAIIGYHLAICAVFLLAGGFPSPDLFFKGWRNGLGLAMSGLCLLSGVTLYALFPLIAREGVDLREALEGLGLSGLSWYVFIAYYSLVNPWMEELFWRGWYPNQLRRPLGSDFLFAGYHFFVLLLFVGVFWAGLTFVILTSTAFAWRELARRTDGLLIPVVSHLIADVSVIVAAVALAS